MEYCIKIEKCKKVIKILLSVSKKCITRSWYMVAPLTVAQWVCIVEEIYVMDRLTHKLRLKELQFRKKHGKIDTLLKTGRGCYHHFFNHHHKAGYSTVYMCFTVMVQENFNKK